MTDAQCLPGANDGALATSWDRDDSEPALHIAFGVAPGAQRTLVVAPCHSLLVGSFHSGIALCSYCCSTSFNLGLCWRARMRYGAPIAPENRWTKDLASLGRYD